MNYSKYIFAALVFLPIVMQATLEQNLVTLSRSLHTLSSTFKPQLLLIENETEEKVQEEKEKKFSQLVSLAKENNDFATAIGNCEEYFTHIKQKYLINNFDVFLTKVRLLLKELLPLNANLALSIGQEKKTRLLLDAIGKELENHDNTLCVSYYSILGLPPKAPQKTIKTKYKEFVKTWHPDKHTQNEEDRKEAALKTREIFTIYEFLTNKEHKGWYDTPEQWFDNYSDLYAYDYLTHYYIAKEPYHQELMQSGFTIIPANELYYDEYKEYPEQTDEN